MADQPDQDSTAGKPRGGPNPVERPDDGRLTRTGHPFEVREGERDKVAGWARFLTSRQIGLLLRGPDEPVSKDTICRHFAPELEWGKANAIMKAGGKLMDAIDAGDRQSILWYLSRMGDPGQFVERRELSGPGGGAIQLDLDLAALREVGLSIEELKDLERVASIIARRLGRDDTGAPAPLSDAPGPDRSGD